MDGKKTLGGVEVKPDAEKLVKVETSNNGAKIAEAFALGANSREVSDEQVYRDPAPLKWRIFEVVAKANGQR